MAVPLTDELKELIDAPNYAHLATLRRDGSPRNWVVWVAREGDLVLVCTGNTALKAMDMQHDARVALSITDGANPFRMAAVQGRVVEVRDDSDSRYMDPISVKYTGNPFPMRGEGRVCFVIEATHAGGRTLGFTHNPG